MMSSPSSSPKILHLYQCFVNVTDMVRIIIPLAVPLKEYILKLYSIEDWKQIVTFPSDSFITRLFSLKEGSIPVKKNNDSIVCVQKVIKVQSLTTFTDVSDG